jgi:hypothetical protein
MPICVDASASNTNTNINRNGHCDGGPHQVKQFDDEDELGVLVMSKGPKQILQLIPQEQVDEFMEEEITDANDYANWLKWVSNVEQSRHAK